MKRLYLLLYLLISAHLFTYGQAEGFEAQLIGGVSAAQIRGDEIAGFNKLGFESGIGVSYPIRYNVDLGVELLYSQRGSRSDQDFNPGGDSRLFKLNYGAIPVVVTIRDWIFDADDQLSYYRIMAQGGLIYSRLLSSSVEGPLGTIGTETLNEAFNENDLSWMLGIGFQFSYRVGTRLRYNRSITKLFKADDHPAINFGDLLPFHLSLQLTYKL